MGQMVHSSEIHPHIIGWSYHGADGTQFGDTSPYHRGGGGGGGSYHGADGTQFGDTSPYHRGGGGGGGPIMGQMVHSSEIHPHIIGGSYHGADGTQFRDTSPYHRGGGGPIMGQWYTVQRYIPIS